MMVKNYDPNIVWGTHIVKVTLQQWAYKGYFTFTMGGNCKGVLEMADSLETLSNDSIKENPIELDLEVESDGDEELYSCVLKDEKGEELGILEPLEHLSNCVVAVEIIDYVRDKDK